MKRLGFSLDWTRYHYSLEPEIVEKVFATFRKLLHDGLIYRGERMVNFCTHCGTAFSDLEIDHIQRKDPLYYLKYGPFVIATTRPETKFGDTAVAFHPNDKRYQKYLGKEIEVSGVNGPFKLKVIADSAIDPKFATGIEKVTPSHDVLDFEIGKRNNLEIKKVIDLDGRLNELAGRFAGLKVKAAREEVAKAITEMGLIDHIDENYTHTISVCYRCGTTIEPMVFPQWFIRTSSKFKVQSSKLQKEFGGIEEASLSELALLAVKNGLTKIVPHKRFEKMYFDWLNNIHDWNISRQIVWGPRIPVWYCLDCNSNIQINFIKGITHVILGSEATPESDSGQARMTGTITDNETNLKISGTYKELKNKYSFAEIKNGLQSLIAPVDATYQLHPGECDKCHGASLLQETDTFDTWFLSGQWPINTLKSEIRNPKSEISDFDYFYPTSVLDTLWDILFFWVCRMMMLEIYLTGEVPFKVIHIHSRVVDNFGKKMSKSKGNVLNPIDMVEKYGADALRMALVYGVAPASDIVISEEKIKAMRNFSNKIWNAARFVLTNLELKNQNEKFKIMIRQAHHPEQSRRTIKNSKVNKDDKLVLAELDKLVKSVTKSIETYRFGRAAEDVYEFFWHKFCDRYIESTKNRQDEAQPILLHVLETSLKLLHPFMPFITEEIYQKLPEHEESLMITQWPKNK